MNNKKNDFENRKLCSECGGRCCKKTRCNYLPMDFESMNFGYLKSRIDRQEISVTSILYFHSNLKVKS
ncbi:MAG: hypothetical protein ACK5HP_01395 [Bacilli bacterium]